MKPLAILTLLVALGGAAPVFGAGLILNEWNAVGENKVFSGGTDTFFNPNYGAITGNGGNWVELVVTTDHLNIQGWTLDWSNTDPDAGSVTFTNNSLWSDLRSGTIITVREDDDGDLGSPVGARPTDASYNPVGNDWWIEINEADTTYVTSAGFKVDNDDWQMRVLDNLSAVQQGFVGESTGAPWSGGGLSSTEAGALLVTPTATNPVSGYADVSFSSYGSPNASQDFTALRSVVVPEPGSLVLLALAACGVTFAGWRRRRKS